MLSVNAMQILMSDITIQMELFIEIMRSYLKILLECSFMVECMT